MKVYLKKDIELSEFMSKRQAEIKEYIEKYSGVKILSMDMCADVSSENGSGRLK